MGSKKSNENNSRDSIHTCGLSLIKFIGLNSNLASWNNISGVLTCRYYFCAYWEEGGINPEA